MIEIKISQIVALAILVAIFLATVATLVGHSNTYVAICGALGFVMVIVCLWVMPWWLDRDAKEQSAVKAMTETEEEKKARKKKLQLFNHAAACIIALLVAIAATVLEGAIVAGIPYGLLVFSIIEIVLRLLKWV